jgi:hypothetical protein
VQCRALSEVLFVISAVAFFLSRIVAYPYFILRNIGWLSSAVGVRYFGGQLFYMALLGGLQVLYIFWFRTISSLVCPCIVSLMGLMIHL